MGHVTTLAVDVTDTVVTGPTALNTTPLLGGKGKKGILRIPVLPLTGVFEVQGATKDEDGAEPAEESELWTAIVAIDSTSAQIQEITLPDFIRAETTTADGDGPDVNIFIEAMP